MDYLYDLVREKICAGIYDGTYQDGDKLIAES